MGGCWGSPPERRLWADGVTSNGTRGPWIPKGRHVCLYDKLYPSSRRAGGLGGLAGLGRFPPRCRLGGGGGGHEWTWQIPALGCQAKPFPMRPEVAGARIRDACRTGPQLRFRLLLSGGRRVLVAVTGCCACANGASCPSIDRCLPPDKSPGGPRQVDGIPRGPRRAPQAPRDTILLRRVRCSKDCLVVRSVGHGDSCGQERDPQLLIATKTLLPWWARDDIGSGDGLAQHARVWVCAR